MQASRRVSPRGGGAARHFAPALPPCPGSPRRRESKSQRRRRGRPSLGASPQFPAAPVPARCGRSAAVPPLGSRAVPRKQSSPCRERAFNSPPHQGELAGKKIHPTTPQARQLRASLPGAGGSCAGCGPRLLPVLGHRPPGLPPSPPPRAPRLPALGSRCPRSSSGLGSARRPLRGALGAPRCPGRGRAAGRALQHRLRDE